MAGDGTFEGLANALGVTASNDSFSIDRGTSLFASPARTKRGAIRYVEISGSYEGNLTSETLVFRKETFTDRFGKLLRINREVSAGDESFDRKVYLEGNVPDATFTRIVSSKNARERIRRALGSGVLDRVCVSPNGAFTFRIRKGALADVEAIERALGEAGPLASELSSIAKGVAPEKALPAEWKTVGGALAYVCVGVAASMFVPTPATLGWGVFEVSIVVGSLLGLVGAAIAVARVRGRSTSLRTVATTGAMAFVGSTFLADVVVSELNAWLDHGPRAEIGGNVRVVNSDYFDYDRVVTASGSAALPRFHRYPTGTVTVLVGEGAFGARWVDRIEGRWLGPGR